MFWGLILEPSRRYSQVVSKAFHITMAAMDETTSDDVPTQVILSYHERNYLLCTLKKGEIVNVPLDLTFDTGDQISFASNGNSHIHLTGYLVETEDPVDSDSDDDMEVSLIPRGAKRKLSDSSAQPKKLKTLEMLENIASDDESDDESVNMSDLAAVDTTADDDDTSDDDDDDQDGEEEEEDGEDDEEVEDEDDDEEDAEEEEEDLEEIAQNAKMNGKATKSTKPQKEQKPEKSSQKKQKESPKSQTKAEKPGKGEKSPQKQQQLKKENGSPKKDSKEPAASPMKKTIESGVTIEDIKVGNGQPAKFGKVVQVYYEGRLKSNNKVFDSSKKGNGFEFRLGRKEVIKGWDVGVQGMKVGGKRRITCPPNMAYGNKGSPPVIPPNSTLVFEVELKKVL